MRLMGVTPTLLVRYPGVSEPTRRVLAAWVVMRPVDDAALAIPLILATELDRVACREPLDPWRDVDVVSDQERLPRRETQDESLVTPAVRVV